MATAAAGGHRRLVIPRPRGERGVCRWCGGAIARPDGRPDRRRWWHPACVETYKLSWPDHARQRLFERDGGVCRLCGTDTKGRGARRRRRPWCRAAFEVDHIVPLIDGGTHALANMQTLCRPCHRAKTRREAAARAAAEAANLRSAPPASPGHNLKLEDFSPRHHLGVLPLACRREEG